MFNEYKVKCNSITFACGTSISSKKKAKINVKNFII